MNTMKQVIDIFPRNRERTDMVLEPLQAMVQLGLLGFAPAGTKLAIQQNVLILQRPSFTQGVIRWYSGDKKDDLYYLFHVFRRFILWYGNEVSRADTLLYKTLIHYAYIGISQLMTTYQRCEMGSLVHVLQMYKMFLKKPEYFLNERIVNRSRRSMSHGNYLETMEDEESRERESDADTAHSAPSPVLSPNTSPLQPTEILNVDLIFRQTKEMYSPELKTIIVNTFDLLEKCSEDERGVLIDGLNKMMYPTTHRLQSWIQERLVF